MMKQLGFLLLLSVVLGLAGCGGGGDSGGGGGGGAPDFGVPAGSGATCPHAQASDVWLNNRLSCLAVGQRVIDTASGAAGAKADTAFVIRQRAYDASGAELLPDNKARHFENFVCLRNAPANLNRQSLAADLEVVMGLFNAGLPSGVRASTLANAGTTQGGFTAMPCDPALHPVIVNYDTGLVESTNPPALANLEVYDA